MYKKLKILKIPKISKILKILKFIKIFKISNLSQGLYREIFRDQFWSKFSLGIKEDQIWENRGDLRVDSKPRGSRLRFTFIN